MNQILSVNNKKSTKLPVNTVIKIFCLLIIVFGLFLTATSSYAIYKDLNKYSLNAPEVLIEKNGNIISLKIRNNKAIDYIRYAWNDSEEKVIDASRKNEFNTELTMPNGNNILYITVRDVFGDEKKYEKAFTEDGSDTIKPVITISFEGGKNIIIEATDENELAYLTYKWNDEAETVIEPNENNKKQISTTIPVEKGTKTLTIIAVDIANNSEKKVREIVGAERPEISIVQEDRKLKVTVSHDDGISEVQFELNGKLGYLAEEFLDENVVNFNIFLEKKGENKLNMKVTSKNNIEKEAQYIYNY